MSMLIPLILLAILSVFGGLLGIPEVLGGHEMLGTWLSGVVPLVHHGIKNHGTEMVLMVVTTVWGLHFTILGWVIYVQRRDLPDAIARRMKRTYTLLLNTYYVDEIYNALIVKPLLWISRVVLWKGVDATGIDGMMVHGTARSVSLWSQLVSAMQSGSLQQYLLYFFSGAVVLLAYFLL